jgi:TonB family protein
MHARQGARDDDNTLTLRVPRGVVAVALALVVHVLVVALATSLPTPKKAPERIAITLQQSSPPPPSASPQPAPAAPAPLPPARPKPKKPAPTTSPVVPELAPSESPPENRAQLPEVEKAPEPLEPMEAPAPEPTWEERVRESLALEPPPPAPTGVLAPSFDTLERVAANDARLHDEQNERRLQEDYGTFFRRGIEALRSQWHPDDVLAVADRRDPTKLCGKQNRTTWAVAVIDRKGNVVDVDMKKPSGCPQLDEEAIAAFLRVAQFPNPPSGLFVNPDMTPAKTARYPVRFIVTFDGSVRLEWR